MASEAGVGAFALPVPTSGAGGVASTQRGALELETGRRARIRRAVAEYADGDRGGGPGDDAGEARDDDAVSARRARAWQCLHALMWVVTQLLLLARALYKRTLRIVTRRSELERVCVRVAHLPPADAARALEATLFSSQQLYALRPQLRLPQLDAGAMFDSILRIKRVRSSSAAMSPLRRTLELIGAMNDLDTLLAELRRPFSSACAEHERLLADLWALLRPDEALRARHTSQWQSLGFQGSDPGTDFRGAGELALQQLLFLARLNPVRVRDELLAPSRAVHPPWFPFAAAGINVTADLCTLVSARCLSHYFFARGASLRVFNELFVYAFVRLGEVWRARSPRNVLAFPECKAALLAELQRDDERGALERAVPALLALWRESG